MRTSTTTTEELGGLAVGFIGFFAVGPDLAHVLIAGIVPVYWALVLAGRDPGRVRTKARFRLVGLAEKQLTRRTG